VAEGNKKIIVSVAILLVTVLVVGGAVAFAKHGKSGVDKVTAVVTTPTSTPTTPAPAPASDVSPSTGTYKDGTYTTTASYRSPGGSQDIGVSITLKDGVVTASSVTAEATDGQAQDYQANFISGYKQYVTGKKIDSISLSRVSGSSLTSNGFNNALKAIESQAKA
jgi:uncharacterized protein with FMN-binding domain